MLGQQQVLGTPASVSHPGLQASEADHWSVPPGRLLSNFQNTLIQEANRALAPVILKAEGREPEA